MSSKNKVCYVEDAEEDSESSVLEGIRDTRRYAVSEAPGPSSPPPKERPNTGKSRGDHRRHSSRRQVTPPSDDYSEEEPAPPPPRREERPRRADREREREREQRDKDQRRKERKQKEAAEQQQQKARAKAARHQAQVQGPPPPQPRDPRDHEAKPPRRTRPASLSHTRTEPVIQQYRRGRVEDPSCYGVQQPAVSGMRPRAQTRPHSYYPGQPAPPISNMGWHHSQQSQPSFPVGSFPGPAPYFPGASSPSVSGIPPSPSATGGPPGFFDMPSSQASAHLRNRFERPASSMGFRQNQPSPSAIGYPQDEDEYEEPAAPPRPVRRASRSKRPGQNDEDRRRMPPPESIPRPKSAMPPPTTPFRAPPQTVTRQKTRTPSRPPPSGRSRVGFADQHGYDDDEQFADSPGLFADSPEAQFDRRTALARTRRSSVAYDNYGADIIPARSTRRGSVAYEQRGIDIVPARNTRRDSFYDYEQSMDSGDGSFDEDKYLDAMKYQDDINGGPAMPLTADALRKASNPRLGGGSSRSSGSHDDSEYKRSNTTGLTRSSSSDTDNVTIKVSGSAVVRVSGAEIECGDGGEITFSRPNNGTSRVGSDRASSYYQLEDVQPRVERKALPYRPHTPSRSDSHHRGYSGNHAPYDPSFAMDDYIY